MQSIARIFSAAMHNGDLRIALQAKMLEARCKGLFQKRNSNIETNLSNAPLEVLRNIVKNSK